MTFCPNCGTQLKGAAPSQPPPALPNKEQAKYERPEKAGRKEKTEYDFVYFLAGGSILITVAVFADLELTNPALMSGQYLAIMLVIIGVIIVLAAVYAAFSGRKNLPSKLLSGPEEKQPITPIH